MNAISRINHVFRPHGEEFLTTGVAERERDTHGWLHSLPQFLTQPLLSRSALFTHRHLRISPSFSKRVLFICSQLFSSTSLFFLCVAVLWRSSAKRPCLAFWICAFMKVKHMIISFFHAVSVRCTQLSDGDLSSFKHACMNCFDSQALKIKKNRVIIHYRSSYVSF